MRGWQTLAAIGAIALVAVLSVVLSPGETAIRISNESAVDLHDVVLTGSEFQHAIELIAAGSSADIKVSARGESSLSVSFIAEGREKSIGEQDYFEGGGRYRGTVVIHSDQTVTVAFRLTPFRLVPVW